ncbi:GMC oxidoreductase [Plantactinospora sp. WMMB782]|uniref:GMC oxidoreductase n=1 Tax=Plantactinospora sp. WMMB782 TaxID=3404121 RepID=UPI003B93AFE4
MTVARERQNRIEADVVIVGAGPVGLALASRLADTGRRVAVLDSGGPIPAPDHDLGTGTIDGHIPYFDLAECRPRGLGGSTGLWGGWCEELDEIDFEPRPELVDDRIATGWCLTRKDLDPYYRDARAFCGIPDVVPARDWLRAGEVCVRDCPFELRSFPVLGPRRPGYRGWDPCADERVDLLLGATVTRVVTTDRGDAVDHLLVRTADHELVVTGRAVVLAVGGIETARLLLSSSSAAWPTGIGNGNDLVGRCFMEHPHIDAVRLHGDPAALDIEFFLERVGGVTVDGERMATAGALVLSAAASRAAGVGRIQLFIEMAGDHAKHPLPRLRNGRRVSARYAAPGPRELAVISSTEQVPNRDSRITLSSDVDRYGVPLPILNWRLTRTDHRTAMFGIEAAGRLLRELGATNVRRRLPRDRWPLDTLGGPHHLGTARMADSPADGVVDGDCRVHGVTNLYITGGAVFPRSGYAPPTLTMIALALRLGDHLSPAPAGR